MPVNGISQVSAVNRKQEEMTLRVAAVALAKLTLCVLLAVGIGAVIILPLHFPIASPEYQDLPTIVPIIGGACSALALAISLRLSGQQSWLSVVVLSVMAFVPTWCLTMFIVLNVKGA